MKALTGRSAITGILMFATAAGTLFVFSLGQIALPAAFELFLTAGGVALATDAVAAICAAALGDIDKRIAALDKRTRSASKKAAIDLGSQKSVLMERKTATFRAFIFSCLISATANVIFRIETLHNVPLALFLGVIPPSLMYILNAILRPLPRDYEDEAQAATKEALIGVVGLAAQDVKTLSTRRNPSESDKQRLATAYTTLGMYGDERETHHLREISRTMGIITEEASVEAEDVQRLLTVDDIVRMWGCSLRTAQDWMSKTPEAKKVAGLWMTTEASIQKRHPMMLQLAQPRAKRKRSNANETQENEVDMQTNEAPAQGEREEMQEAS